MVGFRDLRSQDLEVSGFRVYGLGISGFGV